MSGWLTWVAVGVLVNLGAALWRVWAGPDASDRMMAAQLVGTGGVAIVILLAAAGDWRALDVAVVLAVLAAVAAIAFVKSMSRDTAGDPEEEAPASLMDEAR